MANGCVGRGRPRRAAVPGARPPAHPRSIRRRSSTRPAPSPARPPRPPNPSSHGTPSRACSSITGEHDGNATHRHAGRPPPRRRRRASRHVIWASVCTGAEPPRHRGAAPGRRSPRAVRPGAGRVGCGGPAVASTHEDPHRVRAGHAHGHERTRRFGAVRRRPRAAGVRLAVAERAHQRQAPDPVVALAYAAGRTTRLKFGMSVMVLPGPQPGARGQGAGHASTASRAGACCPRSASALADPHEQQAFGVERGRAGQDLRRGAAAASAGSGPRTPSTTTAPASTTRASRSRPSRCSSRPTSGSAASRPSELRRVGRLGDGWLPSFCTADDIATPCRSSTRGGQARPRHRPRAHRRPRRLPRRRRCPTSSPRSSPSAGPTSTRPTVIPKGLDAAPRDARDR